ncbi:MEDS domain-containing protein [Bailinhaonella thermotolerans]|nr:MEDS domain-containing protein [Bailinhaonella thermotolerans]
MRDVRNVRLGDHLCLAFGHEDEQRAVVTEFVGAGLRRDEGVLYFADGDGRDRVRRWLFDAGVDVAAAVDRGQLVMRGIESGCLASGRFDPEAMIATLRHERDACLTAGFAGLWVTGEMGWAVSGTPGAERLEEFERRLAGLFDGGRAAAICQYDRRVFPPARLKGLLECHPGSVHMNPMFQGAALRMSPGYDADGRPVLRVAGTIDRTTVGVWGEALRAAATWGGDIRVDMTGLEFIDVAGLREVAQIADGLPGDRRLRMRNLAPMVADVIRMVGWDQTPGLVIEE